MTPEGLNMTPEGWDMTPEGWDMTSKGFVWMSILILFLLMDVGVFDTDFTRLRSRETLQSGFYTHCWQIVIY